VSRAAISKWESGRGYPNIDSLKAIAAFFSVTIDELLSSRELMTAAEVENLETKSHFYDLVFGLLDLSNILLIFLPIFALRTDGSLREVSLITLDGIATYLKAAYWLIVAGSIAFGSLTLALQNSQHPFWIQYKRRISLGFHCLGILLFIISLQPYPAVLLLAYSAIKGILLAKKQ